MPSKDGTMDDNKKSTKDVVNKKQKQMMNQEEYLPEEEYDHYRDRILMRGGDHRSKETRERSNTPTDKQPKGKTVYQKQAEKKYGKGKSALDMVKADITAKYGKGAIMDVKKKEKEKKKKDVKEGAGLYANIHAKRKRGAKMRKKGDKGAPSSQDFANAAKTAREELDLTQVAEAFGGHIVGKPIELNEDAGVLTIPATAAAIKYGIPAALAIGAGAYDYYKKRKGEKGIFPDMSKILSNIFASKNKNRKKKYNQSASGSDSTVDVTTSSGNIINPDGSINKGKNYKKRYNKNVTRSNVNVTGDTKIDPPNPLLEPLKKVDKKTLKKVATVTGVGAPIVAGTGLVVNQLTKNQPELLANTPKNNKKTKTKTKKKDDSKRPRLPGVPRLDQGVIGQRTAG